MSPLLVTLFLATLLSRGKNGEEEIVQSLKRKLEYMGNDKNELKEKVARICTAFIQKEKLLKSLTQHFD